MATEVVRLPQLTLAAGPTPLTAEQRYWKTFRNPKSHTTTAAWSVTHISYPAAGAAATVAPAVPTSKANDLFAVTAGPRVDLYSIRKRDVLKSIGRFEAVARSGEIRADGRVLVAGDDSGKMQVFDVSGGARPAILKTWHVHRQPTWVTRWSPTTLTTLLSASDDKTVRLWDLPSADPVRTFAGHQDYVRAGAFLPGAGHGHGNLLVTGSYDATVRLWDARTAGGAVLVFRHAAPVEAVLPMPSGTVILAAADNAVSVLDVVAARPLRLLTSHQKTVTSLCLASHGTRVLSGGLDGHVKVYEAESGGWNVVAGSKYPAPVLSVAVVAAGAAAEDRHLAVGMTSGVLSIKTRLAGAHAEREQQRQRAMTDALAGRDTVQSRRQRQADMNKRLDAQDKKRAADAAHAADDVDHQPETFVIDPAAGGRTGRAETAWQKDLRHQRFGAALDTVLDPQQTSVRPIEVLTLLVALRHRSALRDALAGRDEVTVQPVLKWACRHIVDPRYTAVCTDVGLVLLDLYAEFAAASPELHDGFHALWRAVRREVEQSQLACQTRGMVENLLLSGA